MGVKNAMTSEFLRSAYSGESMAHMRYLIWGDDAIKKGFPNIGRLFHAIAHAERVHASNHFRALRETTGGFLVAANGEFGLTHIVENLELAIAGERSEIEQMYPIYLQAAQTQGENEAERSFHYALEAEKIHAAMFEDARISAQAKKDITIGEDKVYICPFCGFTHIGEHPDPCPICHAKSSTFISY